MARAVVTPRPPMLRAIRTSYGVVVIDSTSSYAALAENVGLCWSHWHLAMGSGRNAATMV
jgi:hypothetical protein